MHTAIQSMTREAYIAFDDAAEIKHEYLNGEIFAMTGGTFNHAGIAGNVYGALKTQLKGSECRPMNSDMRVHTPAGLDTYPDVSVFCGQAELIDGQRTLLNPVLIVEVLSPSTSSYDRGDKFQLYRSIPTLQDYLLVDSERLLVEHFRLSKEREWILHVYQELTDRVPLNSVQDSLALASIYEDVEFSRAED